MLQLPGLDLHRQGVPGKNGAELPFLAVNNFSGLAQRLRRAQPPRA
jgi:hypothetical protein